MKIKRIKSLPVYILLFFFAHYLSASDYHLTILENSGQSLTIQIKFNEPQLKKVNNSVQAHYKNAAFIVDNNKAVVPVITKLFNLSSNGRATVTVLDVKRKSKQVNNYFTVSSGSIETIDTKQIAAVDYMGTIGKLPLFALKIYPLQYNPARGELSWIESIKVAISSGQAGKNRLGTKARLKPAEKKFYSEFIINNSGDLYQLDQPLKLLAVKSTSAANGNPILSSNTVYKIAVKETGLYKITYSDLEQADFPLQSINPKNMRLYNKGNELPVYFKGDKDEVFDPGDYFEFWGEKNEKTFLNQFPDQYADPFSDVNIYWIIVSDSPGRRMVEESGSLIKTAPGTYIRPYAFKENLHFEKDRKKAILGHGTANLNRPSYEMDHWYYGGEISAVESRTYDFHLPWPFEYGAEVQVNAAFRGYSIDDNVLGRGEGHQLALWINNQKANEVMPEDEWHGQELRFVSNAQGTGLPQSNLQHGTNRIRIDMEQTGVIDAVLLNWFDVSYLRKYRADGNYLKFRVQENLPRDLTPQFEIDGFTNSNIHLYKLGVSKIINGPIERTTNKNDNLTSYWIYFQDDVFDQNIEYVALTENQKKRPLSIQSLNAWKSDQPQITLLNHSNAADYLIITEKLFYHNSLRLKELKEAQGYKAEVVRVENIYDLFNDGVKSPIAIKNFIRYVNDEWDQAYPLKYVVFVGDGVFAYKSSADFVPTFLYETNSFGAAASDYWYALLAEDDYLPDIIVSRIPANTNTQLSNYLDKVETYQNGQEISDWRNTALFISGKDASSNDLEFLTNKPIFRQQNLRLINMQMPENMFANRLNTVKDTQLDYDPHYGSTTDLIEYFDDGVSFVNFFGHGGGAIWSDVELLNLTDVDRLNNGGKLPFISSMTCFTGAFENSGKESLSEKMLFAQDKGAIGMLAASGVGWKYNDFTIGWSLYDFLWNGDLTFGEAVNLMKIYYLANPTYYTENGSFKTWSYNSLYKSMVTQYNLFGDPSLKMQKPDKKLTVKTDKTALAAGDTVTVTVTGPFSSAAGKLEVRDLQSFVLYETYLTLNQGSAVLNFAIPDSAASDYYTVKAYTSDGSEDAAGMTEVTVQKSIVSDVALTPQNPQVNQPFSITVGLHSYFPVESAKIITFQELRNGVMYNYPADHVMQQVNDTLYQSQTPHAGFERGGEKTFDLYVRDTNGQEFIFRYNKFYITDNRPDLLVRPESIRYSGTEQLEIEFRIKNDSEQPLNNVKITCSDDVGVIGTSLISFSAGEEKTIKLPYHPSAFAGERLFTVQIDPDSQIEERDEYNNRLQALLPTDHILINHQIGTSRDDINNDTLLLNGRWNFYIAKNALNASTVMHFYEKNIKADLENAGQKDLKVIQYDERQDTVAIYLSFLNYNESPLNTNAALSVNIDTSVISIEERGILAFHRFDEYLNRWIKLESILSGTILSTAVNSAGLYTVFGNKDDKSPFIEITVNGRPLRQDMFLISKPSLAFILQDENGVNFKETFSVSIDGEPVPPEEITYPDNLLNANTIAVQITPTLEKGAHELSAAVADVNGLETQETVQFRVTDDFQFQVFGNYPNPFSDETRISYEIQGDDFIDQISVKIYTTSGRLIRTRMLDSDEAEDDDKLYDIGYHEIIWDGTDDNYAEVANGVYFTVISGTSKGKTFQHTLKIAKLK